MKEKFRQPQTAIRWLFAGFTLLCLLAAVVSAALYHESASDMFAGLGRICTQSGQTVKSYFDSSYAPSPTAVPKEANSPYSDGSIRGSGC